MTKEEAIKKISGLFSADKLRGFVNESCSWDGEIDNATEVKDTFFSTFREEIEQIASMIATEEKVVNFSSLRDFKKGDIIYLCENDFYWQSIIRITDDYKKDYDYFCCEVAICNDGKWEYHDAEKLNTYKKMPCRYATEEEKELFNKIKNNEV